MILTITRKYGLQQISSHYSWLLSLITGIYKNKQKMTVIKVKGKMKNLKNKLAKKKIKQKGSSKKCWCGRPAIAGGYCPEHL